ncbi:MAG: hypothetical protein Q8K98_01615 [Bacteroidota bacterium]|nr:hypothetical protein [Bacteroidota bacterium]
MPACLNGFNLAGRDKWFNGSMGGSKNPKDCRIRLRQSTDDGRTHLNDACPTNPFGGQQAGAGKKRETFQGT